MAIEDLEFFLQELSFEKEKKGELFSEISLKNIRLERDTLFANIFIKKANKRNIDKIIIKGYTQFSKKNSIQFLNIKTNQIINNDKLEKISENIKGIPFISEIKPPQILFKKDSTLLYLYLKKEKINSFDGIINFSSKENDKGLLFTGHLKLDFNNVFNTGEEFKIAWRASGEKRQSFSIYSKLPYIFNTPITPEIKFKIHKQDSTFLNNSTQINLNYQLKNNINTALSYNSINSNNIINDLDPLLYQSYKNTFIGFYVSYKKQNKNKFYIKLNPSFGNRKTAANNQRQFKFTSQINYTYNLNKRNSIYINNTTGLLKSDNLFINELFRIGGANSIRGFDEESIFSSEFSYFNIEYRYKTSLKSYFFSITDLGISKNIEANETLSSLGFGYNVRNKRTSLKLSLLAGKRGSNDFDFNNPKLIIQLTSYF